MNPTASAGLLITLEGIDGAGKSTLAPVLAEHCRRHGLETVVAHEPTNGPWGRRLRESAITGRLSLEDELHYFLEDRREHVAQVIQPGLEAGRAVILDRYYFSTAAYQGARGADPAEIMRANEAFAPRPHLALVLDIDPAIGLQRVRKRGDQPNEFERVEALSRARAIFQKITGPGVLHLDANPPADAVRATALAALDALLAARRQE